jgi:hypothetical protein
VKYNSRNRRSLGRFLASAGILLLTVACSRASPAPPMNTNPSDKVVVIGTIPRNVVIELTAVYMTTVVNDECAPKQRWASGMPQPIVVVYPVHLDERVGDHAAWTVLRDLLKPGECWWQLAKFLFEAAHSMPDLVSSKSQVSGTIVADVCLSARECPQNTARINDDVSDPVRLLCKFSFQRDSNVRPDCGYGIGTSDDIHQIKFRHLLKPDQHNVQFIITDLES